MNNCILLKINLTLKFLINYTVYIIFFDESKFISQISILIQFTSNDQISNSTYKAKKYPCSFFINRFFINNLKANIYILKQFLEIVYNIGVFYLSLFRNNINKKRYPIAWKRIFYFLHFWMIPEIY